MKTQVTAMGACDIGQMYVTDDGKTRIYCRFEEGRLSPYLGICPKGTVTVDWGDGSATDTLTGTSLTTVKSVQHIYASAGDYMITLTASSGTTFAFYGSSNYYSYILRKATDATNSKVPSHIYRNAIQKIELGSGITSLGQYAFQNCYSLYSITIPSTVTTISTYAFYYCYSLSSITIPSTITSISNGAFYYCSSLSSITIPSTVTSIGNDAFQNCSSLSSIAIPSTVTSISGNIFYYCYSLSSITIPSTITSIGQSAFYNCYSLSSITIPTHYLVCYQATPNTEYYGLINGYTVGVPAIGANVYDYYAGSNDRRVYIDDSESEVYLICKTGDPVYELATIADAEMSDATFTLSAEKRCGVTCRVASGTIPYGDNIVIEPQFESGSASTSYMPYSNICAISGHDSVTVTQTGASEHTYSVSFPSPNPGTVYGGTLDLASGKLTVTHVYYTFTGNENVKYHMATQSISEYVYFNTAQDAIMPTMKSGEWTSDGNTMCNMLPKYSGSGQTLCIRFGTNTYGRYIFIYDVSDLSVSSESDMKNWLATNSLVVTYPLETPIVYRLTPVELESLDLGTTMFQCDTGAVTVKYYIPQQVPVITAQPQSQTVSVGNTVTLSVTATASQSMPLTYQWQYSNNQGTTWNNNTASGYNQPVFSFKVTQSMNGRMYRCVISNNAGTAISNTATVTIEKPKEE